jgi:hypothetical protein
VTADAPATLVWIAPDPPDSAESRAIASWARAHQVELRPPRDEPLPTLVVDAVEGPAVAEQVEELLDRARDATAAREGPAIDRATQAAEDLLRAHPELPQAAWLMAEVERARSTRWRRVDPPDLEAAEREWIRAEALDGGRMAGLGETSAAAHPADAELTLALPDLDGAQLDGEEVPRTGVVMTHAGPHALVVTAGGAPVWAGWLEVQAGRSTLSIDAPGAAPCSSPDVARATMEGDALRAERVRCARWVAIARDPAPGALRITPCEESRCGPVVVWRDVAPWTGPARDSGRQGERPDASRGRHWPVWATWVLAGAGVAVAAGLAVAASGALQAAPTETRFVSGGLKNQ